MKHLVSWANFDPVYHQYPHYSSGDFVVVGESPTHIDIIMNAYDGEVNTGKSLTVPNMTMPLGEMLDRFVRGEEVFTLPQSFDSDNLDIPAGIERLDAQDRLLVAREIGARIRRLQTAPTRPASTSGVKSDSTPGVDFEEDIFDNDNMKND